MLSKMIRRGFLCSCAVVLAAGCSEQKMDMSAMKAPERPMELNHLDAWVGNWTSTGECTMNGQTMKNTGTSSIAWDCDKRVLVAHSEGEMGDMGKMTMLEVYTWNPKSNKFNAHFFDSMGTESHGQMTYDEQTRTYHITGKGPDPMTGKITIFEGDAKMIDSSTIEWSWSMWDSWKLKKQGEGKGVMKRS